MEYEIRIGKAMDYISANLSESLSLDAVARSANFSKFHFHRIFKTLTGETVAEFTKRLRLEKAAFQLCYSPASSITDIAMDLGFSSSQNFAKAFKKYFECTPNHFRKENSDSFAELKATDGEESENKSMNGFQSLLSDSSGHDMDDLFYSDPYVMNVHIQKIPPLRLAYIRTIGPYSVEASFNAFMKLYEWAFPRGYAENDNYVSIVWDSPDLTPPEKCRFDAGLMVAEDVTSQGNIGIQTLPGGTYAVYHTKLSWSENIEKPYVDFFMRWLPSSGFQPADGPCYEVYPSFETEWTSDTYTVDIHFPVKPL